MGLLVPLARIILREHRFKNISGRVLCVGRQTVPVTPERACQLLLEEGVTSLPGSAPQLDNLTRSAQGRRYILDSSFFALFTPARVSILDVSAYEGADVLWDLNVPIPDDWEGQFDFIFDGSCLDNIFDPASSLRNLSRLLKPGGRIVHIEHGTMVHGEYLMFPPDWFYDYYVVNRFADCKVSIAEFTRVHGPFKVRSWNPTLAANQNSAHWRFKRPRRNYFVITIAEKAEDSTWRKSPVQAQYRSAGEHQEYLRVAERFKTSLRPPLAPPPSPWKARLAARMLRMPPERFLRVKGIYRRLPLWLQRALDPGEQYGRRVTIRN